MECSGFRRVVRSFGYAFRGVGFLLQTQTNARVHLAIAVAVVGAGFGFEISRMEWVAIVAAIGLVLVTEGLNTALETVVDLVSPEWHPLAGRAKDIAAGAVLLAAIAAAVIGGLIFGPLVLALV
jgi:diacylglycerol kinase (ATP)